MDDQQRQATIDRLFQEALRRIPNEQSEFLERACAELPTDIRDELETLLQADRELSGRSMEFFERPSARAAQRDTTDFVDDPLIGAKIGGFEIQRHLGRGGFGVVYLARRTHEFEQIVALKLIHTYHEHDPTILQRFELERQLLSDLNHPNIAGLLDGGSTDEGRSYYVMEYVDGSQITDYCDANRLTINQRLKLFQQVCLAVAHAHQYSIIHRDLKPANILVNASGTPKLVDFGIAKLLEQKIFQRERQLTMTGQLLMTPEYASPEQVNGQAIGMASDVYSLGIVLYELLTHKRPYDVRSGAHYESARIINEFIPQKPSLAVRTASTPLDEPSQRTSFRSMSRILQGDLDHITMKALRKEPEQRYRSAQELADDIQRYFDGLSVTARKGSTSYHFGKFVRRHRLPVATSVVAAVLVMAAMVGVLASWRKSTVLAKELGTSVYRADMNLAYKWWGEGNLPRVDAVLQRYLPTNHGADQRDLAWYLLAAEYQQNDLDFRSDPFLSYQKKSVVGFDGHTHLIYAFYDDEELNWSERDTSPGAYYSVDIGTLAPTELFRFGSDIRAISRDGTTFATCISTESSDAGVLTKLSNDHVATIKISALDGKSIVPSLGCDIVISKLILSDDGTLVAGWSEKGEVRIWNVLSGDLILADQRIGRIPKDLGNTSSFIFSPNNQRAAFLEEIQHRWQVVIWNLAGDERRVPLTHNRVTQILFTPDGGDLLIAADALKRIDLTADETIVKNIATNEIHNCEAISISPSGKLVAAATSDCAFTIWDLEESTVVARRYFEYWIPWFFFHNEIDQLVGIHWNSIWTWNFSSESDAVSTDGYLPYFREAFDYRDSFDVHAASGNVAFANNDYQLTVWDTKSRRKHSFGSGESPVVSTALSPDAKLAALGDELGYIEVWDLSTNQRTQRFRRRLPSEDAFSGSTSLAFSPDSRYIVSGGFSSMFAWDVVTGEQLWNVQTGDAIAQLIEFDHRGNLLLGTRGMRDNGSRLQIWDVSTMIPTRLHDLTQPNHPTALAFSPDRHRFALANLTRLQLYDLGKSPPEAGPSFGDHNIVVESLSFSPDGRMLFSSSIRGVTLWDVEAMKEIAHLPGQNNNAVRAVQMIQDADGKLGFLTGTDRPNSPLGGRMLVRWFSPEKIDDYWTKRQLAGATAVSANTSVTVAATQTNDEE